MRYKITAWAEHQHYKDRCPPWIKLHHSLLTSKTWIMGTDASRTLAIASMLLAARDKSNDGSFDGDPEFIKRFAYLNAKPDFKQLIEYGFIELVQDASNALAECNTEIEAYKEEREIETEKRGAAFALPDWIDKEDWELWLKTRKGKKMIPAQMQAQVHKLEKWRNSGIDYRQALKDAGAAGWAGLFEPKKQSINVQEARLDTVRQIMGDLHHETNRQTFDINSIRTIEGDGARISETPLGLREPDAG